MLKRAFVILAGLAAAFALYATAFLVVNHQISARASDVQRAAAEALPEAGDMLEILIWNVGYGGLGAGSDFVADGGKHLFPPSRRAVRDNVAGIESFLIDQADADVVLIQEIARAGPVNYWIDVRDRVEHALRDRDNVFYSDFKTRLIPPPLRLVHGQGLYSLRAVAGADLVALPAEDGGFFGVRRRYASPLIRLAGDAHWTIVSVHLAAFDEDASVRTRQLRELMAWAQREYQSGRRVVLGGDWNFQLADTDFPHTTDERFLFWLFPFPQDTLPEGWRIAADAAIPSVRTNHQPYVPGENYVTTIDGFIVSPNVDVLSVTGFDLGFAHSDHQPVRLRVRAR
ncbi:MAG TPA: endonuclease/exonuclease/phosphatase family protein [Vitreimonas sp.]|uniref:endonuclease/exonuclease/phosphatase family protein n=1 Tax=Vitreimonas sp. TaxID=3069702 RepID=UPI002D4F3411|nr:endonuclease/exonuclease/phosphatase family protein [Vitreimonas sp.]HYD86970.1 endonuclease/exonuclease/phosphatase family protein [Vitreimonas sp.]